MIDLGWGHPDPKLLPVEDLAEAATRALERYGSDALGYGYPAGPGPFLEWASEHISATDGRAPHPDALVATAGNSYALDQVISLLTTPGDIVLVEDPTYHLAIKILRDHPVEVMAVPTDSDGINTDALAEILGRLKARRRRARLLYTVATFGNPTGRTLRADRRPPLIRLAVEAGVTIVEDDAYRELWFEEPPPESLWSAAPDGIVVRLVSFSKSLAPGLRCGFMLADRAMATRFRTSGLLDSGGGISHFSSLLVSEYAGSGAYSEHVARLRGAYRERRDALIQGLDSAVNGRGSWTVPGGGFFIWLSLASVQARDLLPEAERHGTSFVPGDVFHVEHLDGGTNLRLSFSRFAPEELTEAGLRLGRGLDACSTP